jgi:hypothetical protein
MKPPDGVVSRLWELLHRPGYENARSHLPALFSGSRRKGVLTMNAKYSTSGSDTWIVDVMDNDTVITSAEADSEENAMAMARTSAHAFYGSRRRCSNTPSIRRLPGQGNRKRQLRQRRGFMENTTDEGSALEELKVWVTSNLPALQHSGATSIVGYSRHGDLGCGDCRFAHIANLRCQCGRQ